MERMTGLEPVSWPCSGRALPIELHPQEVQGTPSASTEGALRQLVKERPLRTVVRWSIAGLCRGAGRLRTGKKKARILSEPGPLRTELEGAQLCASLSRMHWIHVPI